MRSLRRHEGYLLIDHRESPGIGEKGALLGPSTLVEVPTYTCRHCTTVVMLNPDRVRERGHCRKCDHRICDFCNAEYALTGECKDFTRLMDDVCEAAVRAEQAERGFVLPAFKRTIDETHGAAERLEQMARATVLIA